MTRVSFEQPSSIAFAINTALLTLDRAADKLKINNVTEIREQQSQSCSSSTWLLEKKNIR